MRMKKNILFLDIDGTLYDNKNGRIPLSAIEALEKAYETTEIVIATGRAHYMLHSIKDIIHLVDNFVLINGQYIINNNKVIYENPLNEKLVEEIVTDLDQVGLAYGFQGNQDEAISHIDDLVRKSFNELGLLLPPIDKKFYRNNKVYQMWCFGKPEDIEGLKGKYPTCQFIRWLDVGYDILHQNSSKGQGMKLYIEKLGLQEKNIYAIGDGDNDIEMIRDAKIGIAMGNGTPRAKEVADYITDTVEKDGLYKALKHYNLI